MITGTVGYANLANGTYVIKSVRNQAYVVGRAADTSGSNVRLEALSTSATSRTHQQWKIVSYSATNRGGQKDTCWIGADYKIYSASSTGVALNSYQGSIVGDQTGSKNAQVYTYDASDTALDMALYTPPAGNVNIAFRSHDADSGSTHYRGGCLNIYGGTVAANTNLIFWYDRADAYTGRKNPDGTTNTSSASSIGQDGYGSSSANSRWIFERAIFYVKYNGNGSTSGSMSNQTINIDVATALTANAFSRTGYTWGGWATSASGAKAYSDKQSVTNLSTIHKATVNLYAVWTGVTYYVKYNANGGSGTMANSTHVYGTAKALTANAFARTGWTFSKWATASNGTGTTYTNGQSVSNLTATSGGVVNLYAQWTANKYTYSFNANGGTGAPTGSHTRTYGTAATLPSTVPTRKGHTFLGWAESASATSASWAAGGAYNSATASNTTLYAVWRDDYRAPRIPAIEAYRCDANGDADDEGTYAAISLDYDAVEWVDEGDANACTVAGTITPNGGTAQAVTFQYAAGIAGTATATVSGLSTDVQYAIAATVSDDRSSTTSTAILYKTSYIIDVGSAGRAMGLGSAAPASGLEVGYEAQFDKSATLLTGSQSDRAQLFLKRADVDSTQADNGVDGTKITNIGFTDSANRYVGYMSSYAYADGHVAVDLGARTRNTAGDADVSAAATLYAYKNGSRVFATPFYLRLRASSDNFGAIQFASANRTGDAIRFYGATDGYGDAIVIGDGGMVVIGSGESAVNWYSRVLGTADSYFKSNSPDAENTYVTSDNSIYFITNAQTVANRGFQYFSSSTYSALTLVCADTNSAALATSSTNGVTANTTLGTFNFQDKNRASVGGIGSRTGTGGDIWEYMYARNMKTDGTYVNNYIQCIVTKAGAQTYSVSSAANFRSAIGAAASSDRRLKSDVEPLGEDAVEFVKRLEPCVYTINGERQVGLIAQDVHEADSWGTRMAFETVEGVDGLDDWERIEGGAPTWKLDYVRLLPPTITALQRAMERIDQLEATVARLESQEERIGQLEAKLAELESRLGGQE